MSYGMLQSYLKVIIAVSVAELSVMPMSIVSAAPATPGGTDFEIPISELNKVKKKSPSKRVAKEKEPKKKNSAAKTVKSTSATAAQVKPGSPDKSAASVEPLSKTEVTRIHHSPYSFVVAGKRSVIQAVVSSKADIQRVNCILQAAEGGAVKIIVKVENLAAADTGCRCRRVAVVEIKTVCRVERFEPDNSRNAAGCALQPVGEFTVGSCIDNAQVSEAAVHAGAGLPKQS